MCLHRSKYSFILFDIRVGGWAMPKEVGYIYSITSTSSILVHEIPGNSRELDDQTTFSNENYHISL